MIKMDLLQILSKSVVPILQGVCFASVLMVLASHYVEIWAKKRPPGPFGVPFLGSIPWMVFDKPHIYLMNLIDKYGPVIQLKLGSLNFVYINEFETMKKFNTCSEIYQRPKSTVFKDENGFGVATSDGELWKHNRRFVITCLRESGMGKLRVQEKLQEEMLCMNENIREEVGKPFCILKLLQKSSSNIISLLAFDERHDYNDPKIVQRIELLDESGVLAGNLVVTGFFPWLRFFLSGTKRRLGEIIDIVRSEYKETIDKRRKLHEEYTLDSCLLDLYIQNLSKGAKNFSEQYLEDIMIDLFATGTDTVSTTVTWALMYMVKYPEFQSKVQKEIDEVIGGDRFPKIEDKPNLPTTVSVIQEVERMTCLLKMSFPRTSDCKVNVLGYDFKPGTNFIMNLYAVAHDRNLWKDPEKFNPSRFIDSEGNVFRPPHLIPFGLGRRSCIGESLAKMELFLYFTYLMQQYTFHAPNADFSLKEIPNTLLAHPVQTNIVVHLRNVRK